jgi:hypothetical protein
VFVQVYGMPKRKETGSDAPRSQSIRHKLPRYGLMEILDGRFPARWVFQSGRSSPPLKRTRTLLVPTWLQAIDFLIRLTCVSGQRVSRFLEARVGFEPARSIENAQVIENIKRQKR